MFPLGIFNSIGGVYMNMGIVIYLTEDDARTLPPNSVYDFNIPYNIIEQSSLIIYTYKNGTSKILKDRHGIK